MLLMQLLQADQGEMIFEGAGVNTRALSLKAFRRQVQMVFQDSYASLNPRLTMEDSIAFAPQVHGLSREVSLARAQHGVSLVELLIGIAILGIHLEANAFAPVRP